MYPFDHVSIGDVEFILWYRPSERFAGPPGRQWYALDMHMNQVGLWESCCTVLAPCCERHGRLIQSPVFFREMNVDGVCSRHEIRDTSMISDIRSGKTQGKFEEAGKTWLWNIRTLKIHSGSEHWLLRTMTPGGVWL